jgi:hypothetical protein
MKSTFKAVSLTILATLACGAVWAQGLKQAPPKKWTGPVIPYSQPDQTTANVTFLTNLSSNPANLYDFDAGGNYVLGANNALFPGIDQHIAVPFTPLVNGHVKTMQIAIYQDPTSPGTPKCLIALYNDDGTGLAPGTAIAGGSKNINVPVGAPNLLVNVSLAGMGVAVTSGTQYWVVATTLPTATNFAGIWAPSYPRFAFEQPTSAIPWTVLTGLVPALAVKGTSP